MNPDKAYARLEQLMAERDAVIPPPGASRDSPEFAAFLAAENRVGAFIGAHELLSRSQTLDPSWASRTRPSVHTLTGGQTK